MLLLKKDKVSSPDAACIPFEFNPALLRNHDSLFSFVILEKDDERYGKVYCDNNFKKAPMYVKEFCLLHEEGHLANNHKPGRLISQEYEADAYAKLMMPKGMAKKAVLWLIKYFIKEGMPNPIVWLIPRYKKLGGWCGWIHILAFNPVTGMPALYSESDLRNLLYDEEIKHLKSMVPYFNESLEDDDETESEVKSCD